MFHQAIGDLDTSVATIPAATPPRKLSYKVIFLNSMKTNGNKIRGGHIVIGPIDGAKSVNTLATAINRANTAISLGD
jgi:hypothetical protein